MQCILSPTDFSKAGNNAVHYAFSLAIKLQSNFLLTHSIQLPMPTVTPAGAEIPLIDVNLLEDLAQSELSILSDTLKHEKRGDNELLATLPKIEFSTGIGAAQMHISNLVISKRVNMVVMGLSGAGSLKRFFLGSTSRDLINTAAFPVLLIPSTYTFSGIRDIVFATDLNLSDIPVIKNIVRLAKSIDAKIHIVNVMTSREEVLKERKEKFTTVLKSHITDFEISFQDIYNRSEEKGIDWFLENNHVDWLVLVHRQHSFISGLLKAPHSQQIARHASVPILVVPENVNINF